MYFMGKAYYAGLLISFYFKYWNHTANWVARKLRGAMWSFSTQSGYKCILFCVLRQRSCVEPIPHPATRWSVV